VTIIFVSILNTVDRTDIRETNGVSTKNDAIIRSGLFIGYLVVFSVTN
jgi:hypothetical protein